MLGGAICERPGFINEINTKIKELMNIVGAGKVIPVIRKAKYGNDANKIGALYNFLNSK